MTATRVVPRRVFSTTFLLFTLLWSLGPAPRVPLPGAGSPDAELPDAQQSRNWGGERGGWRGRNWAGRNWARPEGDGAERAARTDGTVWFGAWG